MIKVEGCGILNYTNIVHTNDPNEIAQIPIKENLVSSDLLIMEDSENMNNKISSTVGGLNMDILSDGTDFVRMLSTERPQISEAFSKMHVQGTDTTIGPMSADIDMNNFSLLNYDVFDEKAIHLDRPMEIQPIPIKTSLSQDDVLVIENSESSLLWEKASTQFKNITMDILSDGITHVRMLNDERTKLSTVEDYADVTDVENVTIAMNSISVDELQDINSPGIDIEDAVSKRHTQGTDTTLGVMTAPINMDGNEILNCPNIFGRFIDGILEVTEDAAQLSFHGLLNCKNKFVKLSSGYNISSVYLPLDSTESDNYSCFCIFNESSNGRVTIFDGIYPYGYQMTLDSVIIIRIPYVQDNSVWRPISTETASFFFGQNFPVSSYPSYVQIEAATGKQLIVDSQGTIMVDNSPAIVDLVSKKHTQGTDTQLGIMEHDIDLGGHSIINGSANDPNAIHSNVAGEIFNLPETTDPISIDDVLLIEKYAVNAQYNGFLHKIHPYNFKIDNCDPKAIHVNVPDDINNLNSVGIVSPDDILILNLLNGNGPYKTKVSNVVSAYKFYTEIMCQGDLDTNLGTRRVFAINSNGNHNLNFRIPSDFVEFGDFGGMWACFIPSSGAAGPNRPIDINIEYDNGEGTNYAYYSDYQIGTLYDLSSYSNSIYHLPLHTIITNEKAAISGGVNVSFNSIGGNVYVLGIFVRYIAKR